MPRSDMPADRRRHAADRPCAGDQHILADHIELQRRVDGVAQRIKAGV